MLSLYCGSLSLSLSLHASQQQHIALQKQLRVMENRLEKVYIHIIATHVISPPLSPSTH